MISGWKQPGFGYRQGSMASRPGPGTELLVRILVTLLGLSLRVKLIVLGLEDSAAFAQLRVCFLCLLLRESSPLITLLKRCSS